MIDNHKFFLLMDKKVVVQNDEKYPFYKYILAYFTNIDV